MQFRDSTDLQKLMCPTCTYTNYSELYIFYIKSNLETYQSAYTGSKSPLLPYPHCNVKVASHHVGPMARQLEIAHDRPCICSCGGKVFEYSCAYSIPFQNVEFRRYASAPPPPPPSRYDIALKVVTKLV